MLSPAASSTASGLLRCGRPSTATGAGDALPDKPLNHRPALSRHALPDFADLVEQANPRLCRSPVDCRSVPGAH